ncbi:GGDEF domain-containing protein [Halalkalibacter wakoensis]|uniref:GGDEF domain-containing protein n=1 Tax=Halalkalibacter wakoensis TaxID=127891 RepID=UPI0009DE7700
MNDTYSHEGGDLVLKSVVNLVKECLRNTDLIGRYGGEEFVIYLPNTPITIAAQMAEAIRVKIASGHVRYMNEPIHVTSSFGVSSIFQHNESKDTITSLIKQADQALYRAKRSGRNRVECSIETSTMPR